MEKKLLEHVPEDAVHNAMCEYSHSHLRMLTEIEVFCVFIFSKTGSQTRQQADNSKKLKETFVRMSKTLVANTRQRTRETEKETQYMPPRSAPTSGVDDPLERAPAPNLRALEFSWACLQVGLQDNEYDNRAIMQSFRIIEASCFLKEVTEFVNHLVNGKVASTASASGTVLRVRKEYIGPVVLKLEPHIKGLPSTRILPARRDPEREHGGRGMCCLFAGACKKVYCAPRHNVWAAKYLVQTRARKGDLQRVGSHLPVAKLYRCDTCSSRRRGCSSGFLDAGVLRASMPIGGELPKDVNEPDALEGAATMACMPSIRTGKPTSLDVFARPREVGPLTPDKDTLSMPKLLGPSRIMIPRPLPCHVAPPVTGRHQ
ncbi:predicted protein [Verticillium alfalfae VaMs.102]|uniref:Predicted protein n=1 Tax=Verticillium alfalfae (strain VaMs.102 / ATCC MYA-4576 / FGSC 10136) TaxID=526221 RepID=C9SLL3_VERA1|nr:predicted protein [Verticillium alfalfae VaMs.102]EEY19581.1 predicted protein [Verticillium alfalfae VaMs.102]